MFQRAFDFVKQTITIPYHTLSVTQCLSKWYYNYYSVLNRVVYRPCTEHADATRIIMIHNVNAIQSYLIILY